MLWQQTVTAFVWVLALNRWLVEHRPDIQPEQPQWVPVIRPDGQ